MGAALDLLTNAARTLTIEAGAVTDNPIVFPDEDRAISGGNFHAQPVAFAADMISMALCEVGSLSERRTAVLIDPKMSDLPPFLTEDSGVNSGLMIPQVTAAALVAENRSLAFPATMPMTVIAGFLVGAGTTLGSGCTSGHGICGLARFSVRSVVATATFMACGIATVFIIRHII